MSSVRWRALVPTAVLVVAGVAVFARGLDAPFIFDDLDSIPENPNLRQLWPPWKALSSPPWINALAGRPFVRLTLAVNYAIGGLDTFGYHVFNLLVHVLTALLLVAVLKKALARPEVGSWYRDRAGALAMAVALVWLVHPLQTETIAYVVVRTELLATFFYVATLSLAMRGWESERPRRWYVLAIASCALGMMSKEIMVFAPVFVLLWDRTFVAGSFGEAWRRRRGLYSGLAATWLVLLALVATGEQIEGTGVGGATLSDAFGYLLAQSRVILHYLLLSVWPSPLRLVYDWPARLTLAEALPSLVAVGLLFAATVWAVVRRSWLGVAGALFFLVLAPTSSVLPLTTEVVAERRMHLPLVSVVAVGVLLVHRALARLPRARRGWVPRAEMALAGGVVLALGLASDTRLRDYETGTTIWTDAVRKSPESPVAHNNLATQLILDRRYNEALDHLAEALRLRPEYAHAYQNLGVAHLMRNEFADALEPLQKAVRLSPRRPDARFLLASTLTRLGQHRTAIERYRESLALGPKDPAALSGLAESLADTGELGEAERLLGEVFRRRAGTALDHRRLGDVLARTGRADLAIAEYREALRLEPGMAPVHELLGRLLLEKGDTDEGLRHYLTAVAAVPAAAGLPPPMKDRLAAVSPEVWTTIAALGAGGSADDPVARGARRALREIGATGELAVPSP